MLAEKYIADDPDAKVLVLFGGNPYRRDEVIRHLKKIPSLSIIGTLSQEEGVQTIKELPRVDIALIGGRYTQQQRIEIRQFIQSNYPHIKLTEPGVDYPYDEALIFDKVKQLMN